VRCFAFGARVPLVDELTGRFYRRFLGLKSNGLAKSDPRLWRAVAAMTPNSPQKFHLAVIDLASLICKPRNPLCVQCPLNDLCAYARREAPDLRQRRSI
jgi:A/G-specific adenine glycosylase